MKKEVDLSLGSLFFLGTATALANTGLRKCAADFLILSGADLAPCVFAFFFAAVLVFELPAWHGTPSSRTKFFYAIRPNDILTNSLQFTPQANTPLSTESRHALDYNLQHLIVFRILYGGMFFGQI